VPHPRSDTPARHDWAATTLLAVALLALLVPLMEGRVLGWPAWTWVSLCLAPIALVAFVVVERRIELRGGVPLVPPALVAVPSMARGLLIVVPFFGGFGAYMFCYTVTAQVGLGLEAVETGLLIAPMAVAFLLASLVTPRLVARFDRGVMTFGAMLQVIGLAWTASIVSSQWPDVSLVSLSVAMSVAGLGQGLVASPLFGMVLSHVPPASAGAGSGVLATTQQTALALGVATLGNLFLELAPNPRADLGHAFATILVIQLCVGALVAVLTRTLPRRSVN